MSPSKVSTTTARKQTARPGKGGPNVALIAVAAIAAIIVLALLFSMGDDAEEAPPPTPTPAASPVPPPARQDRAVATPEPQPWETDSFNAEEPTPTAAAQSADAANSSACIAFRWTAGLQAGAEEPLDVQVTVQNNCTEDLVALSLVFEARGYREGQEIQTAQGSLYGQLGAGQTSLITITLPATPGGFDRVDLQPLGGE